MTVFIDGYCDAHELERMCRLFFPDEKITVTDGGCEPDALTARIGLIQTDSGASAYARLCCGESETERTQPLDEQTLSDAGALGLALSEGLYLLLCDLTHYAPPWGMLTGVRPVKLMRMKLDEGGQALADETFLRRYHCSESKYRLCAQTMDCEEKIISLSAPESFSLYISIPFCPTRCSYCSFVSQSVEKTRKLVPEYVQLLIRELEATAQLADSLGLRLETVYMGGGTPTTLDAAQLRDVLGTVTRCFDMSAVREFTVEAGRPDTITAEKLEALKDCGVGRISINPQTLNDNVLANIGRRHSAAQVYEAMELARAAGFNSINMDLIAGLPGDDTDSFSRTLDGVFSMEPENVTVHTLSIKRSAELKNDASIKPDAFRNPAADMLDICSQRLPQAGYHPYYLYRQTRMLGNLENVGWSKPGHDGLYNVYIMDETHSILAAGAGGVTKLRQPGENNIARVYNFKFPYEYISRFDEIISRKDEVKKFYEEFC